MLSSEAFVLYNAITMISSIETNLFLVFHTKFQCIEVACHVLAFNEDIVALYLDYPSLLPFLPNDVGKDQTEEHRSQKRISAIVECLLRSLALNAHPVNPLCWCLTIKKDSILESVLSNNLLEQAKPKRRTSVDISTLVLTSPPEGMVPYDITK